MNWTQIVSLSPKSLGTSDHKRDITERSSRGLWPKKIRTNFFSYFYIIQHFIADATMLKKIFFQHNWRMFPYCPELPIWPKIGNWAEELSVISIAKIVTILIPIPKNLQVASSKTLTSTCWNTYRGKGSESRSNGSRWVIESHTD